MTSSGIQTMDVRLKSPYKIYSAAALITGLLFLAGGVELIITALLPGAINNWLSLLQDNWLIVIFKLHAGFSGVQSNLLYRLNILDIIILALLAILYIGLYIALRRTSKVWSVIALAQPFLGMALFIATKTAGRSAVMGAGLVISLVMLRSNTFNRATAFIGILSSLFLLTGDISVAIASSTFIAILTGVGYLLLIIWFFLVAHRLFQMGTGVKV
jgi:hypothetical protein